jgi:hypothetical protein
MHPAWWVFLTACLGYFALGGMKTPSDKSETGRTKEDGRTIAEVATPAKNPLQPLDDYFAVTTAASHPFTTNDVHERPPPHTWDYLIVTVPDPIDSQFGFAFDQVLDATQRALEVEGWLFDRAWLPWELDREKELDRMKGAPRSSGWWFEKKTTVLLREENPGVLLFSRVVKATGVSSLGKMGPGMPQLLAVFLVGENPTSGIDKKAFHSALAFVEAHPPTVPKANFPCLKVAGTYFTGSVPSLALAMDAWWHCNHRDWKFTVVTGSASGVDRDDLLRDRPYLRFRATVLPSDVLLKAMVDYLARLDRFKHPDGERHPIALLQESNTGFGKGTYKFHEPGERGEKEMLANYPVLRLPFPLHISRLRALTDLEQQRQEERLGLPTLDPLVPRLGLGRVGADELPAQDPLTTASVNGKGLEALLATVEREKARYVGVVATDPRDKLFLIASIREHCPNVQVFTTGSDVLLTLPEKAYYLKGTFVATTYPLILENQRWTAPLDGEDHERTRWFFANESAQGYFNAVRALRPPAANAAEKPCGAAPDNVADHHVVEYESPSFRDGSSPRGLSLPPIWITMVGSGGEFVPLSFDPTYGEDHDKVRNYLWPETDTEEKSPPEIDVRYPGTAGLALIILAVCCVVVLVLALYNDTPPTLLEDLGRPAGREPMGGVRLPNRLSPRAGGPGRGGGGARLDCPVRIAETGRGGRLARLAGLVVPGLARHQLHGPPSRPVGASARSPGRSPCGRAGLGSVVAMVGGRIGIRSRPLVPGPDGGQLSGVGGAGAGLLGLPPGKRSGIVGRVAGRGSW